MHVILTNSHVGRVNVDPDGIVSVDPSIVTAGDIANWVSLDGISYRCAPSGSNGYP